MSLESSKPTLEQAIKNAFESVKEQGTKDGAKPDTIIQKLAEELASAIHEYTISAVVTVEPGQSVTTAGTPSSQQGSTTTPGAGSLS